MCKQCVREAFTERGKACLESGFYQVNFTACFECGERDQALLGHHCGEALEEEEEDGNYEETIEFDHKCKTCAHVIATHFYQFRVVRNGEDSGAGEQVQEYIMSCALCGKGEYNSLVLPRSAIAEIPVQARKEMIPTTTTTAMFASLHLHSIPHMHAKPTRNGKEEEEEEEEWE